MSAKSQTHNVDKEHRTQIPHFTKGGLGGISLLTEHLYIWTAADTEKKTGRGRSSANAASVYGINKLRELILGLAISGKLLPQDANDISTSVVVKKVGIKKKALNEVLLTEFSIPLTWEWHYISDLCNLKTGATPSTAKAEYYGGEIPWLVSGDINKKEIWDCEGRITEEGLSNSNCKILPKNSILIALNGQGKTRATVALLKIEAACNQSLVAMIPKYETLISSEFILINLRYRYYEIRDITGQNQRRGLNMGLVGDLSISVPPLAEQHRIVAKVDELMALCDQLETQHNNAAEAHEKLVSYLLARLTQSQNAADFSANWQRIAAHFDTLFTTEASIDALKQTLLQLAVMGKLVPQDPKDEPAGELLKRIQAEKARLIAEGKIRKDKPLPPITEVEKTFDLPLGWDWVMLDDISQVGTGATPLRTKPEYFNPAVISWITSGETSRPYVFETEQYVSPLALKETNLTIYPKGTLIVAMYGQGKTRGQITELMVEACTNQACAAIRLFNSDELHRKYVKLFFEKIYDEIRELAAGGAQPNLNLSKIKETILPLPPLSEQHRIVAKVDELTALCDQLKSCLTAANQLQQKLADVMGEQAVV